MKKIIALVIVLALSGTTWLVFSSSDSPQAADTRKLHTKAATAATTKQEPGLRPSPGLYEYTGSGTERVDVLGTSTNTFPQTITGIVSLQDGCKWTLELTFLEDRSVTRHYCTTKAGVTEVAWTEVVTFFGRSEKRTFRCTDGIRARFTPGAPATWKVTCSGSDDSTSTTNLMQDAETTFAIGTTNIDGVRSVTERTSVSGTTRGTAKMRVWYLPNGLPARIMRSDDVRSKTFFGETPYTQDSDYRLSSVTPTS